MASILKYISLLSVIFTLGLGVFSQISDSAGVGLALSGSNLPSLRMAWRFDLQKGTVVGSPIKITIPDGSLQQCAVSPDGLTAYISTYSNILSVLSFAGTKTSVTTLTVGNKGPRHIEDIKFNPSGTLLALCGTTFLNGEKPQGYLSVLNIKTGQTLTVEISGEFCATTSFCDDTTLVAAFADPDNMWSVVNSYKLASGAWTRASTMKWRMTKGAEPPNHLSCSQGFAVATNFAPSGLVVLSVPTLKITSQFLFQNSPRIPGLIEPLSKVYSLSTVIDQSKGQLLLRNNASVIVFPFKGGLISAPRFAVPLLCPGCQISKGYPYGLNNAAGSAKFGSVAYTGGAVNELVPITLGTTIKANKPISLGAPTNAVRSVCSQP